MHTPYSRSLAQLQALFLSAILPRVEAHGRVFFRGLKCQDRRQDAIAEMVALAWKWFINLVQQGKDPAEFPTALATFAARAVRSGRRLAGQERPKDVLSPLAQQRHNFTISSIPDGSSLNGNVFDQALHDNTQTPVPDQAHFRVEMPRWLASLGDRNRRISEELMVGERTGDVAHRHKLSPGRVAQLRRELHSNWQKFCGEAVVV